MPQLFKKISGHRLGQEEYASLESNDYAIAPEVSDCMVVCVSYRDNAGLIKQTIGHFASRNHVQPSLSYQGFRSQFENRQVISIKYATNYDYQDDYLVTVANELCKNTNLDPQDVQAFKIIQFLNITPYRSIVYYAASGAFKTSHMDKHALDKELSSDLVEVPYPNNRVCFNPCTLL
jgi:hypothetical protein